MNRQIALAGICLLAIGCKDASDVKLSRNIRCREFADKDLKILETELSADSSVYLDESFYSDKNASCIAAFREATLTKNGSIATDYYVYDSVAYRELNLFTTDGTGQNYSGVGSDLKKTDEDSSRVFEKRLSDLR